MNLRLIAGEAAGDDLNEFHERRICGGRTRSLTDALAAIVPEYVSLPVRQYVRNAFRPKVDPARS